LGIRWREFGIRASAHKTEKSETLFLFAKEKYRIKKMRKVDYPRVRATGNLSD
jgi:hypothetical protein